MTRTELLREYGITDRPQMRVKLIQEHERLWVVGINGLGDPISGIPAKKAAELAGRLQSIGENGLASQISAAAKDAQHSNETAAAK